MHCHRFTTVRIPKQDVGSTEHESAQIRAENLTIAISTPRVQPGAMPDSLDSRVRSPRELTEDVVKYFRHGLFTLNFYRAHMLYFIIVIAISSVILYGEGVRNGPKDGYYDSHLSYMDALFLACSAMTTTGKLVPQVFLKHFSI